MKRVKVIFINLVILTTTSLLLRTIGIYFQVYLSNQIGAAGIGLFQLLLSIYFLAITFSTSGIRLAATRLVAEELGIDRTSGAKKAVFICLIYSLTFSLVTALVLFFCAEYIGINWLGDVRTILSLRGLAFSLPFLAMSSVYSGYFTAVRRAMKAASVQVIEQFVRIATTMAFLPIFLPKGLEYACLAVVIGAVCGEVLSFLLLVIIHRLDVRRYKNTSGASHDLTPRMFQIALPVAFSSYVTTGIRTLQQLLVPYGLKKSGSSSEVALATYGTILGMVMPIIMFPSAVLIAVSDLIVPELAECLARGSKNRLSYIVTRVFNLGMLSSLCVMSVFFRYSNELGLAIYNSSDAAYYIRILAPLVPIMYLDMIVDAMLKGMGEQVSSMRYNIIESLTSVALIYILIPRYAISGFLFTIFLTRTLNFSLSFNRLVKVARLRLRISTVLKAFFAMANSIILTNLFFYTASSTFDMYIVPPLFVQFAMVAVIYYILLRLLSCITNEDLAWFKSILY